MLKLIKKEKRMKNNITHGKKLPKVKLLN